MEYKYIIDDREHFISKRITQFSEVEATVLRIEVGDIALLLNDVIIAVFERKTISDLSSSIKDGRYDNKEKMIECREKTACKLFFIIEGEWWLFGKKPSKNEESLFGKKPSKNEESLGLLPYSTLESSLFHLQMRDDIHIIHTKNVEDTIGALNSFAKSIMSLHKKYPPTNIPQRGAGNAEELLVKKIKSDDEILCEIWCALPGIGKVKARTLSKKYTIAEYIMNNVESLKSSNASSLLKKIPLCGKKTVEKMAHFELETLCTMSEDELRTIVPKKCANGVFKFLHIKIIH